MHLLYCDKSNIEERTGGFLLYAGLVIPPHSAHRLSDDVEGIRQRAKLESNFQLKFNPGPAHLDHAQFVALKQDVLEAAARHDVRLLAYVILHDIAKGQGVDIARRNGINTVLFHYDYYLNRAKDKGIVLLDRFNDRGNKIDDHTREKFTVGVTGMPYSKTMRLENILGVHYATIGQSHFCSLIDIVVGSLRFAINAHTRNDVHFHATAGTLLGLLSPPFFRKEGGTRVSELGFQFSPKGFGKIPHFRGKYKNLKAFLAEQGVDTAQTITDEHMY